MGSALVKRLFIILALMWPLSTSAQGVAVYGNWCGPNYPAIPALAGPPVDTLDAACMRHDICTANLGRFDCGCDLAFMNELRNTRWQNPGIQSSARGIYDAIAVIPCTEANGTAQKQSLFLQDTLTDMLFGNATPMDIMDRWQQMLSGIRVE